MIKVYRRGPETDKYMEERKLKDYSLETRQLVVEDISPDLIEWTVKMVDGKIKERFNVKGVEAIVDLHMLPPVPTKIEPNNLMEKEGEITNTLIFEATALIPKKN